MQDLETPAVSSSADGICAWAWNVFPSAEKRQYDLKDHRAPASKSAGHTPHTTSLLLENKSGQFKPNMKTVSGISLLLI